MKHISAMLFVVLTFAKAHAQMEFSTIDSININNINASVLVHGDMWWVPPPNYRPHCQFPANAATSVAFNAALWMSGYDESGQLHVSAQTYRQDGNDYWPGPLQGTDTCNYANSYKWAKIWKINRTDILGFLASSPHTTANTPPAILTWPAKGNVNAIGNAGWSLTVSSDLAPFADLNGNGVYEPLLGEYPDIKGDQALWWVMNDNGSARSQTTGKPLKVEIQAMAYAYNRGTLIDNVVYYEYKITNHSAHNYSNFRFSIHDDVQIGYYLDDYIGFDPTHRMAIGYNGSSDDGAVDGHPAGSYGTSSPIAGVTFVSLPGDAGTTVVPAGSFMYYNNDGSGQGYPVTPGQFNNYMRSRFKDSTHLVDDFAGAGIAADGHGAGTPCDFAFTGDPTDSTRWSECMSGNYPGDRRFIISSNDFTLNAGSSETIVMALVITNPIPGNACPSLGFGGIKTVADTAWNIYHNPLPVATTNVSMSGEAITVFPNPARDKLYLGGDAVGTIASVVIYNTLGQRIRVAASVAGNRMELDLSALSPGVYLVVYSMGGAIPCSATFIKQ